MNLFNTCVITEKQTAMKQRKRAHLPQIARAEEIYELSCGGGGGEGGGGGGGLSQR